MPTLTPLVLEKWVYQGPYSCTTSMVAHGRQSTSTFRGSLKRIAVIVFSAYSRDDSRMSPRRPRSGRNGLWKKIVCLFSFAASTAASGRRHPIAYRDIPTCSAERSGVSWNRRERRGGSGASRRMIACYSCGMEMASLVVSNSTANRQGLVNCSQRREPVSRPRR